MQIQLLAYAYDLYSHNSITDKKQITNQHDIMIKTVIMKDIPTNIPTMIPTIAPVDRPSSDSMPPEVALTDGVTNEVVGKIVEDGVMNTLDITTTSTV